MLDIRVDDLSGEPTRELIAMHLAAMHENSSPNHVFGVATALLEYVIGQARRRGLTRLSLESGSGPASSQHCLCIANAGSKTVRPLPNTAGVSSTSSFTWLYSLEVPH